MRKLAWFPTMSLVVAFERHPCSTFIYFTWTWNHAIILCIMVKPCIAARNSCGNPNCVRVRFVRQQFSLTFEKDDPSGRVEGSKWRRKNRNYTCIVETCVLYSDCELKRDSSTTIMQNHMKSLGKIALKIFCSCGLFSVEFLFITTDHKA